MRLNQNSHKLVVTKFKDVDQSLESIFELHAPFQKYYFIHAYKYFWLLTSKQQILFNPPNPVPQHSSLP